jgi:hypothetical protein
MGKNELVEVLLSKQEMDDLRNGYEREYVDLKIRLDHISSVLSRLGSNISSVHDRRPMPTMPKARLERAYDYEDEDGKQKRRRRKKRGPKSVWGNFILRRLRQADRPISYAEMIRDAMVLHNLPESKRKNARASILNSSFRLRAIHGRIDTVGEEGKKEKYLVLSKWIDENGRLIAPYDERYRAMLINEGKLSDEIAPDIMDGGDTVED